MKLLFIPVSDPENIMIFSNELFAITKMALSRGNSRALERGIRYFVVVFFFFGS